MSCKKFTTDSYCSDGSSFSAKMAVESDLTSNGRNLKKRECFKCKKKNSKAVTYKSIKNEELSNPNKFVRKFPAKACEKLATNAMKKSGRVLGKRAKSGT